MEPSTLCSSFFGVGRYSADFLEGILDINPATNPETTIYTAGEMVMQNSWERPSNVWFNLSPAPTKVSPCSILIVLSKNQRPDSPKT